MSKISKNDVEEFRTAMLNVRPLKAEERHFQHGPGKRPRMSLEHSVPPVADASLNLVDGENLQAQVADACNSSRALCRAGLQRKFLRLLGSASLPVADSFDLHGLTERQACQALQKFMARCQREGLRCVRVVHGKGLRSQGPAVLRLMSWQQLWQNPAVLALKPCSPKDGGAGAVLVLLKSPGSDPE